MNAVASEKRISELSDYISARMGIRFPREQWAELESKITRASATFGFTDAASCIEWLLSSRTERSQLEMLSSFLTVGETFFFRERKGLQSLIDLAFPEIIRAHSRGDHRVRIWSPGCCTGEEPYTVAMMVSDYPGFRDWDVHVLATDINPAFLKKAEAGIYTPWSFRGVASGIQEKFFRKGEKSTFKILPALKRMVTFAHLNLIDDLYPALLNNTNAIDLILCRNVLMYFTPDRVQNVIGKLQRSLLPEGWLLVSPVEAPLVQRSLFTPMAHAGAVLHRKATVRTLPAPAASVRRPARVPKRSPPIMEPLEPVATLALARALYDAADCDGATEILLLLAARPEADAPVYQLLARIYAGTGMLTEAESWSLRAIAADTLNAASRYLLALIRIEQQRPDEAMSALRKAIYLEPDFAVAHFTLANLCRRKRKFAESERHLRNALQILKGYPPEERLPESEGITAGKLIDMIRSAGADGGSNGQRRTDR
jgi:chemotaxis protein methyltransferase CheR